MAFTSCTITHSFSNADGTAASGQIIFYLTARMTNGGTTMVPSKLTAGLDSSGQLSQVLTANNDPDTVTGGPAAQWKVDFEILGDAESTYFITVPTGGGTVDLGSLLPGPEQVG